MTSEFLSLLSYEMSTTQNTIRQSFLLFILGSEDYRHARNWLREAYERFHPDAMQVGFVDKASLLEYLAWAEYQVSVALLKICNTTAKIAFSGGLLQNKKVCLISGLSSVPQNCH